MSKESHLIIAILLGVVNLIIVTLGLIFSFDAIHTLYIIECIIVIILLTGYYKKEDIHA